MQKTKKWILNTFWLSVLLHLVLFLLISIALVFPTQDIQKKSPQHYVPSYFYTGKMPSLVQEASSTSAKKEVTPQQTHQSKKPALRETKPVHNKIHQKSVMAMTEEVLQENQFQTMSNSLKSSEPIYLIGDNNIVADPLIKLIAKSLSAHFNNPKIVEEFGIRGRVLIGLILHPEGYFSDIQVLESSNNQELDNAALYAVNQAPTVEGVDRFLSEPKHFVVGYLFNYDY